MEITSFHFLLFVLGVLIVYHLLPHRAQNIWLLLASYLFYITWSWKFALLLFSATIFHFELAKQLRRENPNRIYLLWMGIGLNVVLFMVFKTSSFYLYRLIAVLEEMGIQSGVSILQIVIPLGLSYYILQNISYLVDVYRERIPASTNRVDFALYLAYFPKMVAGPIERAQTFLQILALPRKVDNQLFARSLVLILVGLTRKLLIANLLLTYIPWELLTENPFVFSKLELISWLIVYAFGLYNDFAGYTSIVRGISGLFGIELSPNFNIPYFSTSFREFWSRWHITLSQWLRDYIFYPTSRFLAKRIPNRNAWQNLIIPPMVTMLISGIWHKPNWQMLLWGGIHGSYLIIERYINLLHPEWLQSRRGSVKNFIISASIFLLVILGWAPFSMGVPSALTIWRQLWISNPIGFIDYRLVFSFVLLIPAICLDWAESQRADDLFLLQGNDIVRSVLFATMIILILVITDSGSGQPFVYQGF
jgi:D-alanyl-lipoteichoic acid acyltransferase DltB (MBOAT superfamily)